MNDDYKSRYLQDYADAARYEICQIFRLDLQRESGFNMYMAKLKYS